MCWDAAQGTVEGEEPAVVHQYEAQKQDIAWLCNVGDIMLGQVLSVVL